MKWTKWKSIFGKVNLKNGMQEAQNGIDGMEKLLFGTIPVDNGMETSKDGMQKALNGADKTIRSAKTKRNCSKW
ncbi:hypothetical protein BpJC4_27690 [Weizmannia acidilactici]|nr:hypothetical protein [Weizmannia acidilactici]GER68298.1 hypothetical protein BpJC4_27690 [Weizmannia acidilactici]